MVARPDRRTGLALIGWRRGRPALASLAELADSAVDLYGCNLAQELGVPRNGVFETTIGWQVTTLLRKDEPVSSAEPSQSMGPVTSSS